MIRNRWMTKGSLFTVIVLLALGLTLSCKTKAKEDHSAKISTGQLWHEKGPEKEDRAAASRQQRSAEIDISKNVFVNLAKKLKPTVVNVTTTSKRKPASQFSERDDLFKKFFEEFFGGQGAPPIPKNFRQKSLGSGFIINPEGYILTNNHVVEGAEKIEVLFEGEKDGKKYKAKIIGRDKWTDLALIKIKADRPLPYAPLGDSDKLQVGEWVIAIGNPFGYGHTVSAGIVSAKERILGGNLRTPYNDYIQTDANIHPGNSGGPLIDIDGKVVGINAAIDVRGAGLGFAIPINIAKGLLPQLMEKGKVTRGWMGVGIDNVTPELAEQLELPKKQKGAIITQVFKGDPADKAGIKPYDVITKFGKEKIKSARDLQQAVGRTKVGQRIKVELLRDGKKITKTLLVVERKEEEIAKAKPAKDVEEKLGLKVSELTPELREKLGVEKGKVGLVIVEVTPYSPAMEAGLSPGQVILEINRKRVTKMKDYNKIVSKLKPGKTILFRLQAGDSIFVTTLKVPKEEKD